jgi:hypothetical protein
LSNLWCCTIERSVKAPLILRPILAFHTGNVRLDASSSKTSSRLKSGLRELFSSHRKTTMLHGQQWTRQLHYLGARWLNMTHLRLRHGTTRSMMTVATPTRRASTMMKRWTHVLDDQEIKLEQHLQYANKFFIYPSISTFMLGGLATSTPRFTPSGTI